MRPQCAHWVDRDQNDGLFLNVPSGYIAGLFKKMFTHYPLGIMQAKCLKTLNVPAG